MLAGSIPHLLKEYTYYVCSVNLVPFKDIDRFTDIELSLYLHHSITAFEGYSNFNVSSLLT